MRLSVHGGAGHGELEVQSPGPRECRGERAISPFSACRAQSTFPSPQGQVPSAAKAEGVSTGEPERLHDSPVRRPSRQFVAIRELEFSKHGRDVGLDRFDRDRHPSRHLFVGVSHGDLA